MNTKTTNPPKAKRAEAPKTPLKHPKRGVGDFVGTIDLTPPAADKTAHTPGWYVANTSSHQGLIIDENAGETIAIAYDKANAPLIAAAPDLLEALKLAMPYVEDCNSLTMEHADQMWAAIAKVEGQI